MSVPPKLAKVVDALCLENAWNTRVKTDTEGRWVRFTGFQQPAWAGGVAFLYEPSSEALVIYVGYRQRVPEAMRTLVGEAITRANYGFAANCLEMDFASGDLRVRTTLLGGVRSTSIDTVRALVKTGFGFAARFFPAIDAVLGGEAPETAVARARSELSPSPE